MTLLLSVELNRRQVLGAAGAAFFGTLLSAAARPALAVTPAVAATSGAATAWQPPPSYSRIVGVL